MGPNLSDQSSGKERCGTDLRTVFLTFNVVFLVCLCCHHETMIPNQEVIFYQKQLASNFKSRELDAPRLKTWKTDKMLVNSENKRVASEGLTAGLQNRDVTERL